MIQKLIEASIPDRVRETHSTMNRLLALGFSLDEQYLLKKIARILHRWSEEECGMGDENRSWDIQRDEETGKPFRTIHPNYGKPVTTPIRDAEAAALKRLDSIMSAHPKCVAYHQTDPRGCPLYIVPKSDIPEDSTVDSCYTNGVAICA